MVQVTRPRPPCSRPAAHSTATHLALGFLAVLLLATVVHAAQSTAGADSLIARGTRAINGGQAEQAERLFVDALRASKNDARAEHGLATVALMRGDADAAIERARKALKRDPKNAVYQLTLANGYGMKAMRGGATAMFYGGKYKQACEAAVECDPKYVDAHMGLLQFYVMAPALLGGGRDKANATAATIERLDRYSGHLARAFLARQGKDLAAAEREYLAAARVDSLDPKGWRMVAWFYAEQSRLRDAIRVGNRVLALKPDDLMTIYQVAKAHLLLGDDLKAAEAGFKRFIVAETPPTPPGRAPAHWRLGQVYAKAGRLADAKAEWERALKVDPKEKHAAAALDSLRKAHPEVGR
ncbi:MAG: tetratricopeptide repeat protein [Candidatus Eisenbacteria bacterium]|nr:tetratricopeptide repeat protein [Candidatus Eisenbacteria bacterium]